MGEDVSKKEHRNIEPPKDKAPLSEGNLVEQIDTILYDIGNSLPEGNADRNEIILGSLELREWARSKQYEFTRDRLFKKMKLNYRRPQLQVRLFNIKEIYNLDDECRVLDHVSGQVTGQFLKRVGLLKPEESLAVLESSDRWGMLSYGHKLGLYGTGTVNRKLKPFEDVSIRDRYLKTTIPGLSVAVFYGRWYGIFCKFDVRAVDDIAKGAPGDSLFAPELNK